jgi:hypothetical protein
MTLIVELTELVYICEFAADIVFDYRQKATRSFEHLQGDYYIAPSFLVNVYSSSCNLILKIS